MQMPILVVQSHVHDFFWMESTMVQCAASCVPGLRTSRGWDGGQYRDLSNAGTVEVGRLNEESSSVPETAFDGEPGATELAKGKGSEMGPPWLIGGACRLIAAMGAACKGPR